MTTESQFWANWWVQLAVAVATFGAVIVALFGQGFRTKFFPPKLGLALNDAAGELTTVTITWVEDSKPQQRTEEARYYHARVWNERRWSPAQQAQVFLLRVEQPGADGVMVPAWVGDVPIGWRHQSILPPQRTIGSEACADLCSVVKGKWLQLHPLIAPNNLKVSYTGAVTLVVTIQVRANESDSEIKRFQISWDGQWNSGAVEMQKHLVIKPAA